MPGFLLIYISQIELTLINVDSGTILKKGYLVIFVGEKAMNIYRTIKVAAYAGLLGFYSSILPAGDLGVEGTVTATTFVGNGSGLTGVVKNEVDPVVGTLDANKWCKADSGGASINCDQNAPAEPVTFQLWVPKTGQTQCWDEGGAIRVCDNTEEDGEYQMGGRIATPEDYRNWHSSFRAYPRFKDHADGTVTDNLTGLIWLKNANCIADNPGFDNDFILDDGGVTWQHGLNFIRGINTGLYDCGDTSNNGGIQTDWRMPNFNELLSLTDFSQADPALSNGHPFLDVYATYYWSSTTVTNSTFLAWAVYIYRPYIHGEDKTKGFTVWPVRGGHNALTLF